METISEAEVESLELEAMEAEYKAMEAAFLKVLARRVKYGSQHSQLPLRRCQLFFSSQQILFPLTFRLTCSCAI